MFPVRAQAQGSLCPSFLLRRSTLLDLMLVASAYFLLGDLPKIFQTELLVREIFVTPIESHPHASPTRFSSSENHQN